MCRTVGKIIIMKIILSFRVDIIKNKIIHRGKETCAYKSDHTLYSVI